VPLAAMGCSRTALIHPVDGRSHGQQPGYAQFFSVAAFRAICTRLPLDVSPRLVRFRSSLLCRPMARCRRLRLRCGRRYRTLGLRAGRIAASLRRWGGGDLIAGNPRREKKVFEISAPGGGWKTRNRTVPPFSEFPRVVARGSAPIALWGSQVSGLCSPLFAGRRNRGPPHVRPGCRAEGSLDLWSRRRKQTGDVLGRASDRLPGPEALRPGHLNAPFLIPTISDAAHE